MAKQALNGLPFFFRILGGVLALFLVADSTAPAQGPEIRKLASTVAARIRKQVDAQGPRKKVLVLTFHREDGSVTELCELLTVQFVSALQEIDPAINLASQEEIEAVRKQEGWSRKEMRQRAVLRTVATLAGAELQIEGVLSEDRNLFRLSLSIEEIGSGQTLGTARTQIPHSVEFARLFTQALPEEPGEEKPPPSTGEPLPPGVFLPGKDGIGEPGCESCPLPEYTPEARAKKYSGKVLLRVVVTPEGRATSIQVVKPALYGLTQNAIETVRSWRFKPAPDASGKPVAVRVLIEVNFKLLP